jgi:hypothetical protein
MKLNAHDVNTTFQNILKQPSFSQFNINKDLPPIDTYKDLDWSTANMQKFVEIVFGRSEIGGIHGNEGLLLAEAYKRIKPKQTIEIGRFNGISTRLLAACCKGFGGKLVSIDGLASKGVEGKLKRMNLLKNVTLIEGWVPWITPDFSWNIDFLFIDGDHSYISILMDYHYFNYFVKKGGYIAFHDMNMKQSQRAVGDIIKRDQLQHICTVGRLALYKKIAEREEKYFEIVKRG